ncbi:GNAT family N-acetyltransferase [Consotaella salsifontis]|uniref:Putative acetyltransferase n=1 Tax=Consotaella salsifontis TaxID=1365950 RepID=A0A1T4R6F0_9HYPH|nr:GNAT family N-acetyltransferase [Consotaella salsifontis]SKA11248.1 putative acetyltransferase [Consotaella salsifontis]
MAQHDQDRELSAPAGLVVRASRPSDAEALAEIKNLPAVRAGTLRPPFQSVESVRDWLEHLSPQSLHLVAELDDRVVGEASLRCQEGRRRHVADLGMDVHDDFAGKGIGTALLAALLDAADNWLDIRRIELTVFADNAPAIALYRKFGFETEGTLRSWAFRDGDYADVLAMARLHRI